MDHRRRNQSVRHRLHPGHAGLYLPGQGAHEEQTAVQLGQAHQEATRGTRKGRRQKASSAPEAARLEGAMAAEAEGVRVERAHAGKEYLMTRNLDPYGEA